MKYGLQIGAGLAAVCSIGIAVWHQQKKKERKQKLLKQCRLELEQFGNQFEGLYEKTAQCIEREVHTEETEELCFCWETRLKNEAQAVGLRKLWEHLGAYSTSVRIKKWFELLLTIGVERCVEREVLVDRDILQRYDLLEDESDYMGKMLQITAPSWIIGEKILEKGILM